MTPRVVVLTPFFRPIMGGVESNAERLARYFGSIGFPVTVLTKRLTPDLPDAESGGGFSIARIGRYGPRSPSAKWMMLRPVYRWLVSHRNGHDVVCAIDCRGVGLAALAARRKTGRRVIAQPQTTGVLVPESGTVSFVRQPGASSAGCTRNPMPLPASRGASSAKRLPQASPATVCTTCRTPSTCRSSGLRHKRIGQSMKQKLGLEDGAAVCVFLGRLSREKGLMDLMEAWSRLRPARAVLVVAGPDMTDHAWDVGPAARAYAQQHGLASSIRFIGPVDDVPALMGAADIVIQPSHFEALGLSAVEALACGVPVVASAVGGLLDFVRDGENGVTCPPHSPDALAAAIGALLTDDGRRQRLASRARASVATVYDEQAVFGRFADLVEQRSVGGRA